MDMDPSDREMKTTTILLVISLIVSGIVCGRWTTQHPATPVPAPTVTETVR